MVNEKLIKEREFNHYRNYHWDRFITGEDTDDIYEFWELDYWGKFVSVSYTHLDVYKRQLISISSFSKNSSLFFTTYLEADHDRLSNLYLSLIHI